MAEVHPAFEGAGQAEGLEIWRIEDFEPVPVPKADHGKFYCGDSYIVLKTTGATTFSYDIHFWLGSNTSTDEAGSAAILSVALDEGVLSGGAVQHRETQGHESKLFLNYFNPGIRILKGGHASGFNHVTTNAGAEKRFFHIKGKKNVFVREVDPSVEVMNNGDCFILDVDHNIYVYVGNHSQGTERIKAISVANQIRDQDHNGRAEIEIIDQFSSDSDFDKFFETLGSGDRESIAEDDGGCDEEFEEVTAEEVKLAEITDVDGELQIQLLDQPYLKENLNTAGCFVLDTGHSGVYVWVGKECDATLKSEALKKAEQYLKAQDYPDWAHVARVPEGLEPTAFKQYFEEWSE